MKGSEIVKGWEKVEGDVWSVALPNSFFGSFNPFSDLIHGDWFDARNRRHHTGAVYLNGKWLAEAPGIAEVLSPIHGTPLWFSVVDADKTKIWAQFSQANPTE